MLFALATVARSVDLTDFSDLTDAQRAGPAQWTAGGLDIPFDRDLTDDEVTAITARLLTTDSAEEEQRALIAAYLSNPAPTPEETVTQLRVLTALALKLMDGPRVDVP